MAMTKKDFELIATTMGRAALMAGEPQCRLAVLHAADDLARELCSTNPRFSRELFGDWVRAVADGTRNPFTGNKVINHLTV